MYDKQTGYSSSRVLVGSYIYVRIHIYSNQCTSTRKGTVEYIQYKYMLSVFNN